MDLELSICSFSFHRGFFDGSVDALRYVELSRELGATHLHFWLPHLLRELDLAAVRRWSWTPGPAEIPTWMWAPEDAGWRRELRTAIEDAGLRQESLAMEKGYSWLADEAVKREHRAFLEGWIRFAGELGIPSLRVDPGGGRDPGEDALRELVRCYREIVALGRDHGVRIMIENHWGCSQQPAVLERLLDEVEGLGYLLDSWNFGSDGERETGWRQLAPRADACHVKTFALVDGRETRYPVEECIRRLHEAGYRGVWGVESVPDDGDELAGAAATIDLIRTTLTACAI